MTNDPDFYLMIGTLGFVSILTLSIVALRGWRDWIALQRERIGRDGQAISEPRVPSASSRIEVADLKERVRKLEAIAAGIEL